ncbi:uncharacterized protein METZ01_LOCUS414745, partial [marine metagenome]
VALAPPDWARVPRWFRAQARRGLLMPRPSGSIIGASNSAGVSWVPTFPGLACDEYSPM